MSDHRVTTTYFFMQPFPDINAVIASKNKITLAIFTHENTRLHPS